MGGSAHLNDMEASVEFVEYFHGEYMEYDIDDIFNADESCFYVKQQDDMSNLSDDKRTAQKRIRPR